MRQHPGSPTFLVTGGTGQIGHELVRELAPLGRVVAPPRAELDVGDAADVRSYVRALRPTVIVNAAAYTAVEHAEADQERCHAVNAVAPGVLAEEATSLGAALVHYSTDYVFDGAKGAPYAEDDAPNPLQAYGKTKLLGEQAVRTAGGSYVILRTSWVYGMRGRNFLRTMLRLARVERELRVVDDPGGAPTWSRMVAAATAQILASASREAAGGDRLASLHGVYHLTAAGATSWYDFARAILDADPARVEQRCGPVRAVSTAAYGSTTVRPAYSVLDGARTAATFGIRLPEWRAQLQLALEDAAAPGRAGAP